MSVQVTVLNGPGSATVGSGGSFVLAAGMLVQFQDVLPDGTLGPIWSPANITWVPSGDDLVLTFPNGETLVLTDALLVLSETALQEQVAGGSPEAELEPAAGAGGTGGGATGSGSIQAASPFVDDGFGNIFGFNPGGGFVGLGTPGLVVAADPEDNPLLAGPVPQPASFTLGMTMGLEDKPIPLQAFVSQNDIEGLGEVLELTLSGLPEGWTLVNQVSGVTLIVGAPGGSSIGIAPGDLPNLAVIPPLNDDADTTLLLSATTSEPTNPAAGVVTVNVELPVIVKAVADPAKITLDNLIADDHPMGTAKNPIQIEMEGRGGSGANDPDPLAPDFGAQDLGTLIAPTADNPNPVVTVDGWLNIAEQNDVDLYKIEIAQGGTYKFDIDFGDEDVLPPGSNVNGRIDDADTMLFLFDAAGNLINSNDDHTGHDSQMVGTLAAGTYYVAVSAYQNQPVSTNLADGFDGGQVSPFRAGDYELSIQLNGPDVMPGDMFTQMVIEDNAQIMTRVALFKDPAFVDTGGSRGDEADEIQDSITAFGHGVTTFTGTDGPSWTNALADVEVLVVPELEVGQLGAALAAGAIQAIQDFVDGGGKLIIAGEGNQNSPGTQASEFLNTVFNYNLTSSFSPGTSSSKTADAAGTAFASAPDDLRNNSETTALDAASLPGNALSLYDDRNGDSTVTQFTVGNQGGQIFYLGWDWFDAAPAPSLQNQDGGWMEVLGIALGEAGAMIPTDQQMWVDPTEAAFRAQRADIDLMVTDTDGSESITRVAISVDPLPPGYMLDLAGNDDFLVNGPNIFRVPVTRILVDGDPPAAENLFLPVDFNAATGEAVIDIDPALRVQTIDLGLFSWKVEQHNDQDFAIKFEVRTTETNPSEGSTLDETQVATPHAYQTATLMVNNKAVADKPMLTIGGTTVNEDNATFDVAMNMFVDGVPVYAVPLEAKVVDDDGSESLTEVQLNSTDIIPFGGEPTFMGTKISMIWMGQGTFPIGTLDIQVNKLDAGGALVVDTVTANGFFNSQGITLNFAASDRVQSVDLSDFGIVLPQHKDGMFDITLLATSTETNPSEAGDIAVLSQTQSETFTLNVQAVADKASVDAPDAAFNEDRAEVINTTVAEAPGSNNLPTNPQSVGTLQPGGAITVNGTIGTSALDIFDNYSFELLADATVYFDVDGGWAPGDGIDTLLTLFDGSGTTFLATNNDSPVDPGSEESSPGETNDSFLGIALSAGTYVVNLWDTQSASTSGPGDYSLQIRTQATDVAGDIYADVESLYATPITATLQDQDGSESITTIVLATDFLSQGLTASQVGVVLDTIALGTLDSLPGNVSVNVTLNDPAMTSATVSASVAVVGDDITLTFAEDPPIKLVDLSGLAFDLPDHKDGLFTIDWSVTTKEVNPMGEVNPAGETATVTGSLSLAVGAVADEPTIAFPGAAPGTVRPVYAVMEDNAMAMPDAGALEASDILQQEVLLTSNETFATAQDLGAITGNAATSLTVAGSIGSVVDIDFYEFTVTQAGTFYLDIDGAAFTLDTQLSLFNSAGQLIAFDDDSPVDPGSAGNVLLNTLDSFIGGIFLEADTYRVAVTPNATSPSSLPFPLPANGLSLGGHSFEGLAPDTTFLSAGGTAGDYQLQIRTTLDDKPPAWDSIGDVSLQDASFGAAGMPTAPTSAILLTTAPDSAAGGPATPFSGVPAAPFADMEAFLDLPANALIDMHPQSAPFAGSAIQTTFFAEAGQELTFDWSFLTREDTSGTVITNSDDLGFVVIDSVDNEFVGDGSPGFGPSATLLFTEELGPETYSFTAPHTGNYSLGIGIIGGGNLGSGPGGTTENASALLVDNVQVNGGPLLAEMKFDKSNIHTIGTTVTAVDTDGSEGLTEVKFLIPAALDIGDMDWFLGDVMLADGTVSLPGTTVGGATSVNATAAISTDGQMLTLTFPDPAATPNDQVLSVDLSALAIRTPRHLSGAFRIDVQATSKEQNPMAPPATVETQTESSSVTLRIEGIADKPEFENTIDSFSGTQTGTGPVPVPLVTTISTPDQDGSETLSALKIVGLPLGSSVSYTARDGSTATIVDGGAGDGVADGMVTIDLLPYINFFPTVPGITLSGPHVSEVDTAQLGLLVEPPASFLGSFTATLIATSTERSGPIAAGMQSQTGAVAINVEILPGIETLPDTNTIVEDAMPITIEEPAATGVLANDIDLDPVNGSDPLTVVNTGTDIPLTYGLLTINADGSYTFVLHNGNPMVDGLNVGDSLTEVYTYTVTDGLNTATDTLTITIEGANDAPLAVADTRSLVEDQAVTTVLGNVRDGDATGGQQDTDVDDATTDLRVVAVDGLAGNVGTGVTGTYGVLTIDQFGAYSYALGAGGTDPAVQAIAENQVVSDVFSYTIDDPGSLTSSATVTFEITGANDPPSLDLDASNTANSNYSDTFTEGTSLVPAIPVPIADTDSLVTDPDSTEMSKIVVRLVSPPDGLVFESLGFSQLDYAAAGGATSVTTSLTSDGPDRILTIVESGGGTIPIADVQIALETIIYFHTGDDPTAGNRTIEVHVCDDGGLPSNTAIATIDVVPTNDAPTAVDDTFAATDEDAILAGPVMFGSVFDDNGSGADSDPEMDDLDIQSLSNIMLTNEPAGMTPSAIANNGASFSFDLTVGTDVARVTVVKETGAVSIEATMGDPFGSLGPGTTTQIEFDYTAEDGNGGTDTATATIDVAGLASVFFIDSNPANQGGAGSGTQADPFHSIAQFNASGAPGPDDIIYLRTGSGYNEADGINLQNGQTLIGQGQGLDDALFDIFGIPPGTFPTETAGTAPTINVTALNNHGIELAQDNTIRGLDIGNTSGSGAGIDDGGGAGGVGNLTISDVAITGTGKAFDVDSSGTLDVTFKSITSTGSTSEGIDLNNVSGSFTVTGNTSVTNSGDTGVDISGSSGTFNFGGLDVDNSTSNQRGLDASGGGTINVTGTGSAVDTGTATAIDIDGTTIGTNGMTFESVSSSGGTATGIVLNNAGSGGFTVTGNTTTTTAGSGGTIADKTGVNGLASQGIGVFIQNTDNVSLSQMQLDDFGNFGIRGNNVDGFELIDSVINGTNGNSNAEDEGSISFDELTGTANIHGSNISGGFENNIVIINTSGTLNFDMDDTASNQMIVGLNAAATGGDSMLIEAQTGATANVVVENTNFTGARESLFRAEASGNASTLDVTLRDNIFNNTHGSTTNTGGGVSIASSGTNVDLDYLIEGSSANSQTFNGAVGNALSIDVSAGSGSASGTIQNNAIGTLGGPGSGSQRINGIFVGTEGTVGHDRNDPLQLDPKCGNGHHRKRRDRDHQQHHRRFAAHDGGGHQQRCSWTRRPGLHGTLGLCRRRRRDTGRSHEPGRPGQRLRCERGATRVDSGVPDRRYHRRPLQSAARLHGLRQWREYRRGDGQHRHLQLLRYPGQHADQWGLCVSAGSSWCHR